MNDHDKFALIRRKTRQRFLFASTTMVLYFSFVLNYSAGGRELVASLSMGSIPGALVMFCGLIIAFICLELLFLFLNRDDASK